VQQLAAAILCNVVQLVVLSLALDLTFIALCGISRPVFFIGTSGVRRVRP